MRIRVSTRTPRPRVPAVGVRRERRGSTTHQDLVVCPGDGDQAVLPSRANTRSLLDADVYNFWKVTEGLEGLGMRGRAEAGGRGPFPSEPPIRLGSLDPTNPHHKPRPFQPRPAPAPSHLAPAKPRPLLSITPHSNPLQPIPKVSHPTCAKPHLPVSASPLPVPPFSSTLPSSRLGPAGDPAPSLSLDSSPCLKLAPPRSWPTQPVSAL